MKSNSKYDLIYNFSKKTAITGLMLILGCTQQASKNLKQPEKYTPPIPIKQPSKEYNTSNIKPPKYNPTAETKLGKEQGWYTAWKKIVLGDPNKLKRN